ncbi:MAG: sensor histidine kinase [Muribaculaceae bacterium]
MDSKKSWKNSSYPLKVFITFSVTIWVITLLGLLAIIMLDIEFSLSSAIAIILLVAICSTAVSAFYAFVFSRDIANLQKFVQSLSDGTPTQVPNNISTRALKLIAQRLFDEVKKVERIRTEQQAAQQESINKQKEALRSKQILANNLNHEIKTPIGIIQGYIDTLLEHDNAITPEMRQHFLKKCLDNTLRLQNMAFNMSVITRIENGKDAILMDDIDLIDTLNTIADDLAPLFEKNGITFVNLINSPLIVRSNSTVLYNIFSNLSKNAVFYSGGNKIVVEMLDDQHLSFRDNGKGVDTEYLTKIFDRFYRIDRDKNRNISSSGLGLSIVKESVELHGWTIEARNHPEGGLQFIFNLDKGK